MTSSERGAVLPFVAVMVALLVSTAAFATDLGMQRVARGDMQSLADVVALDAARLLNGRTRDRIEHPSATDLQRPLADVVADSQARNGDTVGARPQLRAYLVKADDSGTYPAVGGVPTQVAPAEVPNAVVVTASTDVAFGFARAMGVGSGSATRKALARTGMTACYALGSYAAAVRSGDSAVLAPLGKLLGLSTDLGAVGYSGLAGGTVSLAGIAASPRLGTPDALVSSTGVRVGTLVDATIDALQHRESPPSAATSAAITALGALKTAAGFDLNQTVRVGDALGLAAGNDAALDTDVNVLDLLASSIGLANGQRFLASGTTIGTGASAVTVGLSVIQRAQRACGKPSDPAARLQQSQVKADVHASVAVTPAPVGHYSVGSLTAQAVVNVTGGVGNATAQLVAPPDPVCAAGTTTSPDTYRVDVTPDLLGLNANVSVTLNGTVPVVDLGWADGLVRGLLTGLGLRGDLVSAKLVFNQTTLSAGASTTTANPGVQHADLKVPQNAVNTSPAGTPVATGQPSRVLAGVSSGSFVLGGSVQLVARTAGLLGLGASESTTTVDLSNSLLSTLVSAVLGPIVDNVANKTLDAVNGQLVPLAKLLGIRAPGADVYAVARPSCADPQLIG